MHGILVIAISTLLSGVSAICVLPAQARYYARPPSPDKWPPALLLSSNYPAVTSGLYKDHICGVQDGLPKHWRCAYGPDLKASKCKNDYNRNLADEFVDNSGRSCHVDTTSGQNNGVWVCMLE